jgi:hypothetical protein
VIFLIFALMATATAGYGAVFAGTGDLPRSRKAGLHGMVRTAGATWSGEIRADWTNKKKSWSKARVDRLAKRAKGSGWDKAVRRADIMAAAAISAIRSNNRATWKAVRSMPDAYRAHQANHLAAIHESRLAAEAATKPETPPQEPAPTPGPGKSKPTKGKTMETVNTEFTNVTELAKAAKMMAATIEDWQQVVAGFAAAAADFNGGSKGTSSAAAAITDSLRGFTATSEAVGQLVNACNEIQATAEALARLELKSTATVAEITAS